MLRYLEAKASGVFLHCLTVQIISEIAAVVIVARRPKNHAKRGNSETKLRRQIAQRLVDRLLLRRPQVRSDAEAVRGLRPELSAIGIRVAQLADRYPSEGVGLERGMPLSDPAGLFAPGAEAARRAGSNSTL